MSLTNTPPVRRQPRTRSAPGILADTVELDVELDLLGDAFDLTTVADGNLVRMSGNTAAPPTRFLNELEMAAWRTFIETHYDLMAAIEADMTPSGLALGDYQVLVTLSEASDHRMRMCDLASILQLTPSGATRRLDGLVRSGWVDRLNSDVDRRVMLAVLTPAGWDKLHEALHPHVNSVRERLIDLLDETELRALASTFAKVRAALDR